MVCVQLFNGVAEQGVDNLIEVSMKMLFLTADRVQIKRFVFRHGFQYPQHPIIPIVEGDTSDEGRDAFVVINPVEQIKFILEVVVKGLPCVTARPGDVRDGDFVK